MAAGKCRAIRGFTFAEILTVIAIIGVLVALLLPAVQACREAARRMMCSNRLGQLIVAVHNYNDLHGVYPPGTIDDAGPIRSVPQGYHHNWIVQLLPYLEQKNAYAHIDPRAGVYDRANRAVRRLHLAVLNCPSSRKAGRAYSDYAAVHHDVEAPIDVDNNGTFFLNSRIGYFDVRDGTSNTIFVGEKITIQGDLGWMSGTRATLRNTGVPINLIQRRRAVPNRGVPLAQSFPRGLGGNLDTDEALDDELTLELLVGDSDNPFVNRQTFRYGWERSYGDEERDQGERAPRFQRPAKAVLAVGGFGSEHPGGAMFAMGDGSVRFLSDAINGWLFQQLGHRSDQELISDEW